jgi:MFS family permease
MNRETGSKLPAEGEQAWWQGLDRYCWVVLVIAALGWLFDMMDQQLFNLVRVQSLRELLKTVYPDPALLDGHVRQIGGYITAIFLLGWSVGGFFFGVLGDKIGRTRTMILTILVYAGFTGLTGLAQTWQQYAVCRFLTALGVGGEWAAGAAIVAEVFPQRSRTMALGVLQSLSTVGNMMAAVITYTIAFIPAANWRWVYFVGTVPALLVLWIRRSVKEPECWKHAKEESGGTKELGSIKELVTNPELRRNTVAGLLLGIAGIGALWGVSFFGTDLLIGALKGKPAVEIDKLKSIEFFVRQFGALIGALSFAVVCNRYSRKAAFHLWFALAWISVLAYFGIVSRFTGDEAFRVALVLGFIMGFGTLGPLTGYTIYFPELFPTRLRTTGCGICYNGGRIVAALAPWLFGSLAKSYSLPIAAAIVSSVYILGFIGTVMGPETKGKPLPE